MRRIFLFAVILCWLVPVLVMADDAANAIIQISSKDLASAYTTDKNAAEAKYTGKMVELTGVVVENYTMAMDTMPYVSLEGNEMGSVNCYFDAPRDLLEKGREVIIRGKCSGALFGSPDLENSEIVKR